MYDWLSPGDLQWWITWCLPAPTWDTSFHHLLSLHAKTWFGPLSHAHYIVLHTGQALSPSPRLCSSLSEGPTLPCQLSMRAPASVVTVHRRLLRCASPWHQVSGTALHCQEGRMCHPPGLKDELSETQSLVLDFTCLSWKYSCVYGALIFTSNSFPLNSLIFT